jgi:hypothetical protein
MFNALLFHLGGDAPAACAEDFQHEFAAALGLRTTSLPARVDTPSSLCCFGRTYVRGRRPAYDV